MTNITIDRELLERTIALLELLPESYTIAELRAILVKPEPEVEPANARILQLEKELAAMEVIALEMFKVAAKYDKSRSKKWLDSIKKGSE